MDVTAHAPSANGSSASDPEEVLDRLLRQIITGFFVLTDGQGAVSKWSEPAELLFGVAADEAIMEPFFGKLVPPTGLSAEGEAWRRFLEMGETTGSAGRLRVDAYRPGGGTFAMEAVFVPVKLDEGFDFSLFLEDLGFELPIDMMLLRMRQQHPVVIRALRAALEATQRPWDGVRTAGTLVAFRPLEETTWMDAATRLREEQAAEAEDELQSRIDALDAPEVQGTDVYDLEDARAVIDRLKWATERIEELEERSRATEDALQQAADARARAEAAELTALDVRAEVSSALADRPVDIAAEASRLELLARVERVERAAQDAGEAASAQRLAAEAERARTVELEAQRAELLARLEQVEQIAGATSVAEASVADASVADARAELIARMEALEAIGSGGAAAAQAASAELVVRLEALERTRAQEAAELRAEIALMRAADVREDVSALQAQFAEAAGLRAEIDAIRERADAAGGVLERGEQRDATILKDAEATRTELAAALKRIEQLSEETARLGAQIEAAPASEAGLSGEDRHRLELAAQGVEEARTGLEAVRSVAEELRAQSAELRDEGGRLQARLNELSDEDGQAKHDADGIRREQEELRAGLEELRRERDDARDQLRDAVRTAEEARALAARGPSADGDAAPPATSDEVVAARARLAELGVRVEAAEAHAEQARAEAAAARDDVAEIRGEAREAQRTAREAGERIDMVDRANQTALVQITSQAAVIEEVGALSRTAQKDSAEGRAAAGEARAIAVRLEQVVATARDQVESAVAEAAGAREQAAAATQTALSVRGTVTGVGDVAREAAGALVEPLTLDLGELRAQLNAVKAGVSELLDAPGTDSGLEAALDVLRADLRSLRAATEGGDPAAVEALSARLDTIEEAGAGVPSDLDARMDGLRAGLAGALDRLEGVSAELASSRADHGTDRHAVEQRLADTAAELMAARTDAEQARRGLEGLHDELSTLREYAAAAKAEAAAAKQAVAGARKAGADDDRQVHELRTEVQAALATVQEFKHGFEEARQAAVAARRDAEQARAAAEKAGAVNEVTTEKFTEVWQRMLAAPAPPQRAGSGVVGRQPGTRAGTSKPGPVPPARPPRSGFDDDARPMAVLDLNGRFRELNPAFAKLVGYREHEFGKASWPSVLDRRLYKEQKAEFEAMVAGELTSAEVQSTYMHSQGLMVLINGVIGLVRDEAGEPHRLVLIAEPGGPSH